MSEIFIIKNTGKGVINSLAPENVVPIKSAGSSDGGVITEDSDTVAFTGNGTAGNPLSAKVKDVYSTTETLTGGTWIDGKPIYSKYITISLPSGSASAISFAYPTFKIIDFEKCFLTLPSGTRRTPNGTNQGFENDWVFSIENDSSLLIKPDNSSAQIRTISGVLLYTKTTD